MINFANDDERQGGVICIVTLIKTEIVNVWSIVMKVTVKILSIVSLCWWQISLGAAFHNALIPGASNSSCWRKNSHNFWSWYIHMFSWVLLSFNRTFCAIFRVCMVPKQRGSKQNCISILQFTVKPNVTPSQVYRVKSRTSALSLSPFLAQEKTGHNQTMRA